MYLKVFLKLKKTLETLSSGQILKKKKKKQQQQKTKKPKKPTGLGFLEKNTGFLQPCLQQVGLVVRAGALRPLPNGDGGGGGRERAGGRELLLLQVG
jgi:hypothetical protein